MSLPSSRWQIHSASRVQVSVYLLACLQYSWFYRSILPISPISPISAQIICIRIIAILIITGIQIKDFTCNLLLICFPAADCQVPTKGPELGQIGLREVGCRFEVGFRRSGGKLKKVTLLLLSASFVLGREATGRLLRAIVRLGCFPLVTAAPRHCVR
jgi:hypothetical protein